MKWEDLTIKEKAEVIKLGIKNGLRGIKDIKDMYNSFSEKIKEEEYIPKYDNNIDYIESNYNIIPSNNQYAKGGYLRTAHHYDGVSEGTQQMNFEYIPEILPGGYRAVAAPHIEHKNNTYVATPQIIEPTEDRLSIIKKTIDRANEIVKKNPRIRETIKEIGPEITTLEQAQKYEKNVIEALAVEKNPGLINVSPEFYALTLGRAGMNGALTNLFETKPISSTFMAYNKPYEIAATMASTNPVGAAALTGGYGAFQSIALNELMDKPMSTTEAAAWGIGGEAVGAGLNLLVHGASKAVPAVKQGVSKAKNHFFPKRNETIQFIRNGELPIQIENGKVMLVPESHDLVNMTLDQPVIRHNKWGKHGRINPIYYTIDSKAFTGKSPLSIDPSNVIFKNEPIDSKYITVFTADKASAETAKKQGLNVINTSEMQKALDPWLKAESKKIPLSEMSLLEKAGPTGKNYISDSYNEAVTKAIRNRFGSLNYRDMKALEKATGLSSGAKPNFWWNKLGFNPGNKLRSTPLYDKLLYSGASPVESQLGQKFGFGQHPINSGLNYSGIASELGSKPLYNNAIVSQPKASINHIIQNVNNYIDFFKIVQEEAKKIGWKKAWDKATLKSYESKRAFLQKEHKLIQDGIDNLLANADNRFWKMYGNGVKPLGAPNYPVSIPIGTDISTGIKVAIPYSDKQNYLFRKDLPLSTLKPHVLSQRAYEKMPGGKYSVGTNLGAHTHPFLKRPPLLFNNGISMNADFYRMTTAHEAEHSLQRFMFPCELSDYSIRTQYMVPYKNMKGEYTTLSEPFKFLSPEESSVKGIEIGNWYRSPNEIDSEMAGLKAVLGYVGEYWNAPNTKKILMDSYMRQTWGEKLWPDLKNALEISSKQNHLFKKGGLIHKFEDGTE